MKQDPYVSRQRVRVDLLVQPALRFRPVALGRAHADAKGLTEFLATDGGKSLLAQALAPLQAASGIRLTPEIAPAGPVSPVLVQRFGLPAFSVRDVLLTNDQGHPVLSLCAELGTVSDGVLRLVQPFVGRQDFAYAVSASVLDPAYKACWSVAARGLSVVGEMPVDLPVGDDPSVTRPGRAQLSVSFSDVLDEAAIKVVPALRGDAIRLLSKQRIQLLNLWDYQDKRITDLGELADPHDEILAFPLTLFEEGGAAPEALDPNVKDLMVKLLTILVFPMMQPFSIRAASVSGFCSSALQTVLVRWTHKTLIDDLRPPVSDISTRARI